MPAHANPSRNLRESRIGCLARRACLYPLFAQIRDVDATWFCGKVRLVPEQSPRPRRASRIPSMDGPRGGKTDDDYEHRRDTFSRAATDRSTEGLGAAVASRVSHRRGVRVAETGALRGPEAGHSAGTGYVVIEARTLTDCDHAETNLASIARLPPMAWDHGWSDGDRANGWPFRLRIFPGPSTLTN